MNRPHPVIAMTNTISQIERGEATWYGVLVSREMYAALELRTAAFPEETPLANRYPVRVKSSLTKATYELVDRGTWDAAQ